MKTYKTRWLDQDIEIKTKGIAELANGSVFLKMGGTTVLATTVIEDEQGEYIDFAPLSVHYFEKSYASNKIPGGYTKREGRPQDHEVKIARLIDRSLRPLMPDGLQNEVQIMITILGYDKKVGTVMPALLAASLSLRLSGIPLKVDHNVCGLHLGMDPLGNFVPWFRGSDLDLFLSISKNRIMMLEGMFQEIPHTQLYKACQNAIKICQPIIDFMDDVTCKHKIKFPKIELFKTSESCRTAISEEHHKDVETILKTKKKKDRSQKIKKLKERLIKKFVHQYDKQDIILCFYDYLDQTMATQLMETEKRIDGRHIEDIRPIKMDVGILPHAHGSALFTRGDTQVMSVLTVAGIEKNRYVDDLKSNTVENFIFHYNFPSFCVGEIDKVGAPNRREIGHGLIGWRALKPVLPNNKNYTYRIVSEVLSSNGSSSMASVCAASLAFMKAGIPIQSMVAGIGLGYMRSFGQDIILTDILGDEDHMGLMDLKIAGTSKGLTTVQLDVKSLGISPTILSKALTRGRQALNYVLSEMAKTIESKSFIANTFIPKIETFDIHRDKISEVIGKGGSEIKKLSQDFNVKVDIKDFGLVTITGEEWKNIYGAKKAIRQKTSDFKKGDTFDCFITQITPKKILVKFNKFLSGYIKFRNQTERKKFLVVNSMDSELSLVFSGLDQFGNYVLVMHQTKC